MSIAGLIEPAAGMNHKKSFHRRNDSGELDVFEAARYFSGYNEAVNYSTTAAASSIYPQKINISSDRHRARISLDMPMRSLLPQQFHGVVVEKQTTATKDQNKKHNNKQPSSPGGRLASFLNSLFSSQSASRKKKSKDSSEDEGAGGGIRRRRRSSISHFRFSSSTAATATVAAADSTKSLSSGFRTPPYVVQTPTKNCREFIATSANNGYKTVTTKTDGYKAVTASNAEVSSEKQRRWMEKEKTFEDKRFDEVDEGCESDSSSDLFELQNYDLGSGLPVYETTNMDSIKRGVPITN